MKRSRLDKIDKKILSRLQSEGRVTNVELAKSVGISAPPCLRRVRALEDAGFIKGYYANLNRAILGYGVCVFAMVKLKSHAEEDLQKFNEYVQDLDMVRECHMLTGDVDFLLKIVAQDWDAYQNFLTQQLTKAPQVESVRSAPSVKCSKFAPGVPVE